MSLIKFLWYVFRMKNMHPYLFLLSMDFLIRCIIELSNIGSIFSKKSFQDRFKNINHFMKSCFLTSYLDKKIIFRKIGLELALNIDFDRSMQSYLTSYQVILLVCWLECKNPLNSICHVTNFYNNDIQTLLGKNWKIWKVLNSDSGNNFFLKSFFVHNSHLNSILERLVITHVNLLYLT